MSGMDMIGRRVLVVGGSRGIGRACCLEFAAAGADIAFIYHASEAAAREVEIAVQRSGRRALRLRADVADGAAARAAVSEAAAGLNGIDVLIHSAGPMVEWTTVRDHDPGHWARFIAIDLIGAFNCIQAVTQLMHAQKRGVIIAVSSIAAQMCQSRNSQAAASKAGLEALIRVVAKEEGQSGIRANAVAVGITETDMARDAAVNLGQDTVDRLVRSLPIQRMGRPEEVARIIRFLASDEAGYITGKVLQVDGGQFIGG